MIDQPCGSKTAELVLGVVQWSPSSGEGVEENGELSLMSPTISQVSLASNMVSESDRRLIEENEKLREMMEKLIETGKEQVIAISKLTGRVKDLEKKLARKKKPKTRRISAAGLAIRMEKETHVLEINLISAQGLKTPSANLRRMQTYALAWVDPSAKLRTLVDRVGGQNPTWNDKFLFRVASHFVSSETSAVSVEIYAVGCIKDHLVGTVRFLLSNCISGAVTGIPSFTALQIRRPSGRFHGVLNIAATLFNGLDSAAFTGLSAVCFRDLMRERRRHLSRKGSEKIARSSGGESNDLSCGDSDDFSDGANSTTSSSSATSTSTALKEWNGRSDIEEKKDLKSDGAGMLCGLMLQRKIHRRPFDQNSVFNF
ncbi:hypothetical protein F0562_019302 [Nyssa sinensis]|uniref:C2 domain-containing protein n=1 Tax=Nyssa sinensis TaxID=561372 RepID=A0A5J4ZBM6_9ASTE|nr:hypothetical protein F0562_019302 [Nyssa sinensis]